MMRSVDVEKRREWEERFAQFRASGLTVARFCASGRVREHVLLLVEACRQAFDHASRGGVERS